MDTRRFLIPAVCWLALSSCAGVRPPVDQSPLEAAQAPVVAGPSRTGFDAPAARSDEEESGTTPAPHPSVAPQPGPPPAEPSPAPSATERPYDDARVAPAADVEPAKVQAASPAPEAFVGEVRVFDWTPGRVFKVRAAPLRVTTLTLAPGEALISKAAGDTVRWQIGEVASGVGSGQQTHVVLKPLRSGLATNLVLTTNRRVYLIDLESGPVSRFDPAVAWSRDDVREAQAEAASTPPPVERDLPDAPSVALPQGEPDGRYRIEPQGRKARWTPTAVFNDGLRTFITFDPDLQVDEAPALFVVAPNGERQLVNYRQVGGLFVVDRIFDRAELRLGDRRPQIVILRRLGGAA